MGQSLFIDKRLEIRKGGLIGWRLRNNSGGTVNAGAVVVLDTTVTGGDAFTTTTTQDDPNVLGVCMETVADGEYAFVAESGFTDILKVNGTTDIAVGDKLTTFTTAGIAAKQSAITKPGVFAIALEAYATNDSNGVINAYVVAASRVDASGVAGGTVGLVGEMAADGVGAANALGATTTKYAPISHVHTNTADTPALTFGTANTAGTAGSLLAADATIALFDTTAPTNITINASAAVGSIGFPAHRDHVHGFLNVAAPADGSLGTANDAGSNNTLSRGDHSHKSILTNDTPLILGTTDAAATACRIEYDTAETVDALKIGVNTASRRIIICDYGDMGTDSTLALAADPELVIYDNTFADYIRLRATTAGGFIDVPTGDSIAFQVAAATEFTMDATALTVASGNRIDFDAAAGAYANLIADVNNLELLDTQGVASAVNQWGVSNAATGAGPILEARGDDAAVDGRYLAKGTGAHVFDNGTDPVIVKLLGAAGGYNNEVQDVNGNEVLALQGVASAVNEVGITNAATTVNPSIIVQGGDANIGLNITLVGTGALVLDNGTDPVILKLQGAQAGYNNEIQDVNGNEILALQGVASAVNELGVTNAIATANPALLAQGGDANISITITAKAAGQLNVAPGTAGTAAAPDVIIGGDIDSGLFGGTNIVAIATAGAEAMRCSANQNLHIANSTAAATQPGTKVLYLTNAGTNPSGTIANGAAIYCSAGEIYTLDAGGVATLQSPHDEQGEWVFHSYDPKKNKTLHIRMERILRLLASDPRYEGLFEERDGLVGNHDWH